MKEEPEPTRPTRRTSPRKEAKSKEREVIETASKHDDTASDQDGDSSNQEDQEGDSSFGGMSLDVLAMVATDRLEHEPKKKVY